MDTSLKRLVESSVFHRAITGLIILNAVVLGMETIPAIQAEWGPMLATLDLIILGIFVVELLLRIAAHRLDFFRDPWSLFDFAVVAVSLSSVSGLSALRAFRVFRVLRLLNAFPTLRRVIGALLSAIPGVASVGTVLLIILFVASVIATKLFADGLPELFGSLFTSMFTLFQVMTLEGWPDVAARTLAVYPHAWLFFVVYILIGTLTMLNLFVAIIVSAMEENSVNKGATEAGQDELLREIRDLRAAVDRLCAERKDHGS